MSLTLQNALSAYTLHLADTTLILAQRNAQWCAHGPILEQDIAITNISLDLLGQSRNFYQYGALLINQSTNQPTNQSTNQLINQLTNQPTDEDKLAYLRKEREFKNLLLAEQPNGDWAQTVLRQFLFSQYQYLLFEKLQESKDEQLAAIAAKSIKETKYHLRWSSEWVIRLGDGTEESKARMLKAIANCWAYTGEMFMNVSYETVAIEAGIGVDCALLKDEWSDKIKTIFEEATLPVPDNVFMQGGGKEGIHTENLGYILADLQYLQRTYPGSEW
jgi:ring-1,2-phenylacetyl-CoA epoxidase subunit PaaC